MRKKALTFFAITTLLLSLVSIMILAERTKADPTVYFKPPTIKLSSPESNKTYYSPIVNLQVSFQPGSGPLSYSYTDFQCFLDQKYYGGGSSLLLMNLEPGLHTVKVTATVGVTAKTSLNDYDQWVLHHIKNWMGSHPTESETIMFNVAPYNETISPTPTPSSTPTQLPTVEPSPTQNPTPTITPSNSPTKQPTPEPTTSPNQEIPLFTMPQEYLHYSITTKNGVPWAIIDGTYPIYCASVAEANEIAMVYPTPPGTTNITIRLNNTQLDWSNFTDQYPTVLHHTALGDWAMIATSFQPSNYFLLTIHYEHPIIQINASNQFLYDLNISPYLSLASPQSDAYFTLSFDKEYSNIKVFNVPPDLSDSIRNPVSYNTQPQGDIQEVTFTITSKYDKPLPGDVIVTFEAQPKPQDSTFQTIAAAILIVATIIILGAVFQNRKGKHNIVKKI